MASSQGLKSVYLPEILDLENTFLHFQTSEPFPLSHEGA